MRADLFEIPVDEILFTADQPVLREGAHATLSSYEGQASNLLAFDRINLDRESARRKYALKMAGEKPDDETLAKGWEVKLERFNRMLWTVRETLMDALAPGPPQADEAPPEPDAPQLQAGLALLDQPDVLAQAGATVRALGYAGDDTRQPQLLTLVLVSRSLERPTNVVVTGPSSAGKSHLVGLVTKLFPEDATYVLAGMSERVLAYSESDLRHRYLIIGEASALAYDGMGASLLRTLAWEGKIRYEVVEKNALGQQVTRVISRDGPTGFITTTTGGIEGELATRVLPVFVDDTPAGTKIILKDTGQRAAGAVSDPPDLEPWWAGFWWLQAKGDHEVVIPFGPLLAERYPYKLVRTRRDFAQLLNLIRAAAILHQRQRQRDSAARIIATLDDYRVVYRVAADVFAAVTSEGLTKAIRETVEAVEDLLLDKNTEHVSIAALSKQLGIDTSAVDGRVKRAIKGGWLVNVQERNRGPRQLRTGTPMPDAMSGLPDPDDLEAQYTPPDPPPIKSSPLYLGVQLSNRPDSVDSGAENGWTNANVPSYPTVQPNGPTVGRLDNTGQTAMSDSFADSAGQNVASRTVGHGDTGKRFSAPADVQPRPTNDQIVGEIEWITKGHTCTVCRRTTFWRWADKRDSPRCVSCHPPSTST